MPAQETLLNPNDIDLYLEQIFDLNTPLAELRAKFEPLLSDSYEVLPLSEQAQRTHPPVQLSAATALPEQSVSAASTAVVAETTKPLPLRTKIAQRAGVWATRAAVTVTAAIALVRPLHFDTSADRANEAAPLPQASVVAAAANPAPAKPEAVPTEAETPASKFTLVDLLNRSGNTPVAGPEPSQPPVAKRIMVQKGEWLSKIAQRELAEQGVNPANNIASMVDKIKVHNPTIKDPNKLFPGQELTIPSFTGESSTVQEVIMDQSNANKFQAPATRAAQNLKAYMIKDKTGALQFIDPKNSYTVWSWGASTILAGCSRYAQAFPGTAYTLSPETIDRAIAQYWDGNPNSIGYVADIARKGIPGTDRYIDDGMWAAQLRLQQYAIQLKRAKTPDASALSEAQTMINLAMRNVGPQGMIYWLDQVQENRRTERPGQAHRYETNTISSALTIETALLLNQFINDPDQAQKNLDFAISLYSHVRSTMLDPSNNLYYDKLDGQHLDKSEFPYNAGSMIGAGVWLYGATGDKQYLQQAEQTAAGALTVFDAHVLQHHDPQFVAPLLDSLYTLSLVTANNDLRLKTAEAITTYATWYGNLTTTEQIPMLHRDHLSLPAFYGTQLRVLGLASLITKQVPGAKGSTDTPHSAQDQKAVQAAANPASAPGARSIA